MTLIEKMTSRLKCEFLKPVSRVRKCDILYFPYPIVGVLSGIFAPFQKHA